MTQQKDAPRYEIATIQDFTKIPADRLCAALGEFAAFIEFIGSMKGLVAADKFTWVDDGKHNVSGVIRDQNGDAIAEIEIKGKP